MRGPKFGSWMRAMSAVEDSRKDWRRPGLRRRLTETMLMGVSCGGDVSLIDHLCGQQTGKQRCLR